MCHLPTIRTPPKRFPITTKLIFQEAYDIYLTPTLAYPPVKIGEPAPKPIELVLLKIINALGLGRLLLASGVIDMLAEVNKGNNVPIFTCAQ
jgi:hypothetical protein